MANIIIIEPDNKTAYDQLKLIEELHGTHNADHVSSLEVFEADYLNIDDDDAQATSIDLIIFKLEVIGEKSVPEFITDITNRCLEKKYIQSNKQLKFIILKYENDGIDQNSLIHPNVYDIIYTPMDRLLYLQKLEIILKLPKKPAPSYLFSTPIIENIEISKRTLIQRVSSSGFSMINPVKINIGTLSRIYIRISKTETLGLYARAVNAEANTQGKGFLIDFIYYGLSRSQNAAINFFLRSHKHFLDLEVLDNNQFLSKNASANDTDYTPKHVLILDDEEARGRSLSGDIENSMSYVMADYEDNLPSFTSKYLQDSVKKPSQMSSPEDLPTRSVVFEISLMDQKLIQLQTDFKDSDHMLHYDPKVFFTEPTQWKNIFNSEEGKKALQGALAEIAPNSKIKKIVALENKHYEERIVLLEFMQISNETARITIKPMMKDIQDFSKNKSKKDILKKIDLIIVNKKFIPEEPGVWMENLREKFIKNGMIRESSDLKFIIVTHDKDIPSSGYVEKFIKHPYLINYFQGTPPKTLLMISIGLALKNPYTKYCVNNIAWAEKKTTCYIAKKGTLNSLSEFGASITSSYPVQPGVVLFMHGYIFEHSPNGTLPVRFYFNEEDKDGDKVSYISYFIYFGITDHFLRFARKWIKNNYASKKDK